MAFMDIAPSGAPNGHTVVLMHPELAKHIANTIPGAQLVLVPGAGHVLHLETPEIFNRELVKFLKSDLAAPSQNGR